MTPEQYRRERAEQLLNEIAGRTVPRDERNARRLEAARLGKARRPFWLVQRLDEYGDLQQQVPYNFRMPTEGLDFSAVFSGAATSDQRNTTRFNFVDRSIYVGERTSRYTIVGAADYAGSGRVLAGDLNVGDERRVTVPGFLPFEEPVIVVEGGWLNLEVTAGGGVTVPMDSLHFVLQGTQQYADTSDDGQLSETELASISQQIADTEPRGDFRAVIQTEGVDNGGWAELPSFSEWNLLLGFASISSSGSLADLLWWVTAEIQDYRGHDWSNDRLPLPALCAMPQDDRVIAWRYLDHPYLVAPGKGRIKIRLTSLPATAAGEMPDDAPSQADEVGTIVALLRPV